MVQRRRLVGYVMAVIGLNLAGWGALLLHIAPRYPGLLGLGVLAFTFGLRHAFDADHISAIDNTTRKLLQEEQPAEGVGFYFSLGHSTVVALLALGLGLATRAVAGALPTLEQIGTIVGASVSGTFLYLIALLNLAVLADVWRIFGAVRAGTYDDEALEQRLQAGGLMSRVLGRLMRLIRSPKHMYPVGLLFGLGFDTASEVALLAVSAGAASRHLPIGAVMVLPLLFAAGMALMDTVDGAFMAGAYTWAFSTPLRKVYYNLTVTGLSVLVAVVVGTVELGQVIGGALHLTGGVWAALQNLNFESLGYLIVGVFVLTWASAYGIWKVGRLERR